MSPFISLVGIFKEFCKLKERTQVKTQFLKMSNNNYVLSNNDVEVIVKNYLGDCEFIVNSFEVRAASEKMIGFLCDYWKLNISITIKDKKQDIHLFVKAICRNNPAKAAMVQEMKLFLKECNFYQIIKKCMNKYGLRIWSPNLVAAIDNAMVLEDLTYLNYRNRNKLIRFDMAHTLQALETLANFHSMSIIYEEHKRKRNPTYNLFEDFEQYLDAGGYTISNVWLVQCMQGALEAVKVFSKHCKDKDFLNGIEEKWEVVWKSALTLCDISSVCRNVVCHRDLWNNNILFHYNDNNEEPNGCALVDFQAVKLQPPAGDVMMLLHCNLDPLFRETNMTLFLNYYYEKLEVILNNNYLNISKILPKDQFMNSANEQRKWGLIVCACLLPQIWINDELTTSIFTNNEHFEKIMTRSKGEFIINMMNDNIDYRTKVMEIFDEIIDRFINY